MSRAGLLARLGTARDGSTVVLDLGELTWADPAVLAGAAAHARRAAEAGLAFRLRGPVDVHCANYAARMHLGRVVTGLGGTHDLPDVREQDLRGHLLEVSELQAAADVRTLAELVHGKVEALDPEAAVALHTSLSETGGNVLEHAGTTGYAAAQTYAGSVWFAVADAGPGLLGTLRGRGAGTDREAIAMALAGSAGFPTPTAGRACRRRSRCSAPWAAG